MATLRRDERRFDDRRPFLTADWRHLLMLNFDVEASVLEPLVPAGTILDLWHGRALISVVGFRFLRTCIMGVPVPGHRDFEEVNLRFYVRRHTPDAAVRRGVTFVRELVPRAAIALLARLAYNEPYWALPMRSEAPGESVDRPRDLAYQWRRRGQWEGIAASVSGSKTVPADGSEAAFITEHYWGYTRQRNGVTAEYEVAHPRWAVWPADSPQLVADVSALYGPAFASALDRQPCSAFVAEGSPVVVYRPTYLTNPAVAVGRPVRA
jgi:uncharacterized protein YqjF (DUF2071 family)